MPKHNYRAPAGLTPSLGWGWPVAMERVFICAGKLILSEHTQFVQCLSRSSSFCVPPHFVQSERPARGFESWCANPLLRFADLATDRNFVPGACEVGAATIRTLTMATVPLRRLPTILSMVDTSRPFDTRTKAYSETVSKQHDKTRSIESSTAKRRGRVRARSN